MDIQKGKASTERSERNKQLVEDYLSKDENGKYIFSIVDLVKKYSITPQRIRQIRMKSGVEAR